MTLTETAESTPYRAARLPLSRLDGRTKAGRILRRARLDILLALGRPADPIEAIFADTAAALTLHLHLLTARATTAPDAALAARLANELARTLAALGLCERTPLERGPT